MHLLCLFSPKAFPLNTVPEGDQSSYPWQLRNVLAGGLGLFLLSGLR